MKRKKGLKRTTIRRLRQPGERKARQLVYARSEGICEVCYRAKAAEWHHRKNRSQGGEWSAENGLHLCGQCHRMVTEGGRVEAMANGWAVSRVDDPAETPVLVNGVRWVYLTEDGQYSGDPPLEAA